MSWVAANKVVLRKQQRDARKKKMECTDLGDANLPDALLRRHVDARHGDGEKCLAGRRVNGVVDVDGGSIGHGNHVLVHADGGFDCGRLVAENGTADARVAGERGENDNDETLVV